MGPVDSCSRRCGGRGSTRCTCPGVERLTDEAVAVTFAVPRELWDEYAFLPGQHLTLRATIGGEDVRQSYSICQPRSGRDGMGQLRVASAVVEGGRMSTWLNSSVAPGDEIEVMTPMGSFTCPTQPTAARHHVAIAAGSGITPVLSLIATALREEPSSRVTLLFGNRRTSTVMFLEELEDLKNRYPGRFHLVHVLSREPQDVDLFHGRLDPERLARILDVLVPVDTVDEWYLCGPFGMVTGAETLLKDRGVDPHHIHHEIFHVDEPGDAVRRPRAAGRRLRAAGGDGHGHPGRPDHRGPDAVARRVDPRRDVAGPSRRAVLVHERGLRYLPRSSRVR